MAGSWKYSYHKRLTLASLFSVQEEDLSTGLDSSGLAWTMNPAPNIRDGNRVWKMHPRPRFIKWHNLRNPGFHAASEVIDANFVS